MLNFLLPNCNYGGLTPEVASQYHRASERCMSHISRSLKQIIKDTEKRTKLKLSKLTFIREHDSVSHSAQVTDKKRRRFYICLMMGDTVYLEEFNPYKLDESYYIIAGIGSSITIVSASVLRSIFDCIPDDVCDLGENRCRVSKKDFLSGVHVYVSLQPQKNT